MKTNRKQILLNEEREQINKQANIASHELLVPISIYIAHKRKTLSFSKSDRQTLQYSRYVKWFFRFLSRFASLLERAAWSMDSTKRVMNHVREYWYIGSMFARSAIEKNRIVE